MVERFHRQLKAALKAQPNSNDWMATLPLILLGIRTALKRNLNSSTAEMVYGTTLCLPGEFITPSPTTSLPQPSEFLWEFRHIKPTSTRQNTSHVNILQALSTATHVFVCHDAVRKPLQPPYDGPYPVIKRTDKYYTIKLNGCTDTISIHRLKPAHLDSDDTPQEPNISDNTLPTRETTQSQSSTTSLTPHPPSSKPPSPASTTPTIQRDLVVVFIFLPIFHTTCKTLGGELCSNI